MLKEATKDEKEMCGMLTNARLISFISRMYIIRLDIDTTMPKRLTTGNDATLNA